AYRAHIQKIYAGARYLSHIDATMTQEQKTPGLDRKVVTGKLAGFVIRGHDKDKKERAFIVTAAHIIPKEIDTDRPYDCVVSVEYDFGKEKAAAEIYAYDKNYDVALLVFKDPKYVYKGNYAKFGKPDNSVPGDEVIALGSPTGDPYCVSAGLLSRKDVDFPAPRDLIIHTAGMTFGNSGGPLLNSDGEVIGMNIQVKVVPLDKFGLRIMSTPFGIALSAKSILFIMPELERGNKI
ncbi:MAG: serine protease, partial [bacterium]|nr:serine protease [bacterium]